MSTGKGIALVAALAAGAAGAGGGVFGILPLLNSIPAMFAGGGAVMGMGKGIAVVLAAGAVIGGIYVVSQREETPPPPRPAAGAPVSAPTDWITTARDYLSAHPGDVGLSHMIAALERLDAGAISPHLQELRDICTDGWQGSHPAIADLLQSQRPALDEAVAAASAEWITLPPLATVTTPVPAPPQIQALTRLLVAEGRRDEAQGRFDQAAGRVIEAARFSEQWLGENTTPVQYLVVIGGLTLTMQSLESTLRAPGLSMDEINTLRGELAQLDTPRVGVAEALRSEKRMSLETVRRTLEGAPGGYLRSTPEEMRDAIGGDLQTFEAEHGRMWDDLIANAERPYWEREVVDEAWVRQRTDNMMLRLMAPSLTEMATRADVALAHVRLCRTLVSLRDDVIFGIDWVASDPFNDMPVSVAPDRVWSVGPDEEDQGGALSYDPTNGTVSPGDIVALR
jgi:hypothetical protein